MTLLFWIGAVGSSPQRRFDPAPSGRGRGEQRYAPRELKREQSRVGVGFSSRSPHRRESGYASASSASSVNSVRSQTSQRSVRSTQSRGSDQSPSSSLRKKQVTPRREEARARIPRPKNIPLPSELSFKELRNQARYMIYQ